MGSMIDDRREGHAQARSRAYGRYPLIAVKLALAAALGPFAATGCGTTGTEPVPAASGRIVMTTRVNGRPKLFTQSADGSGSRGLRFLNVADSIPDNRIFPELIATDDNLLALSNPRWDASGSRVAVVATTAYDQSEIVVLNVDGSGAQVASVSSQIIASAPDWSPDGRMLAYTMSTLPYFGGIDLFVTDLAAHTVRRLTTGANLGRAVVRWSADGRSIYFSRRGGTTGGVVPNTMSDVVSLDVATLAQTVLRGGIVGEVQAISRFGTHALVLRDVALLNGHYLRDLVRAGVTGSAETVLASSEPLLTAAWGQREDHVVLSTSVSVTSSDVSYEWLQTSTGDRRRLGGIAGEANVDLYVPFQPD